MNHNTAKVLSKMNLMPKWIVEDEKGKFYQQLRQTVLTIFIHFYASLVFLATLLLYINVPSILGKDSWEYDLTFVILWMIYLILMIPIQLFFKKNSISTALEGICKDINILWPEMINLSKDELSKKVSEILRLRAKTVINLQISHPQSTAIKRWKDYFAQTFDDCVTLGLVDEKAGWEPFWKDEEKPTAQKEPAPVGPPEPYVDPQPTLTTAGTKSDPAIGTGWPQPE